MSKRQKRTWFVSLLVLLLVMISVGGVTRLTKSGLSITEWKPVTGILPPLSDSDWQEAFQLYQDSPEYKIQNHHFELEDYKGIFWWEYVHRVLGRIIFFVALALGLVFWRKKEMGFLYAMTFPLLIALQGLVGWLMVKSGLNLRPSVSHYMLAVHFFFALFAVTYVYYPFAKLKKPIRGVISKTSRSWLYAIGSLIILQIFYGCLTGGLRAGYYFNTFPLMGGGFLPPQGFDLVPVISNFVENPITVQWTHRWIGILLGVVLFLGGYLLIKKESLDLKSPMIHLMGLVGLQILIGISTLIYVVPVSLATLHQFMAVLIWLGYCNIVFRMQR